jgi:hypothetical protein
MDSVFTTQRIAKAVNVSELISANLSIPNYQRPYTWRDKHVLQLMDDLKEAYDSRNNGNSNYLIGTIIIYNTINNSGSYDIVDGQQRLTTLSLILIILDNSTSIGLGDQKYNHLDSQKNLKANYHLIKQWIEKKDIDKVAFRNYILGNVWFVQILAPSQDEAFIFFDSQNSRGKPLEKYDLLKAHHLRFISSNNENVAEECTIYWEKIDKSKRLGFLIDTILGRTRVWSRRGNGAVDVLEEFKSQRISNQSDGFYKLNKYHQPPLFEKWRFIDREEHDDDDGLELVFRDIDAWQGTKRLRFVSESKKYMPFHIMQPLEGGEQFFWFIEKYNQLYNDLFTQPVKEIPTLFTELHLCIKEIANWNTGVYYILEVFESCGLFYYDKFGTEKLVEIACYFEHQLSILRFRQSTVQYASINKFIQEFNLFAVISEAAFPEHIIRSIKNNTEGRYKFLLPEEMLYGVRKHYFEVLYGDHGFYSKNRNETELSGIIEIKQLIKSRTNYGN